jgi:hypothetical protein
MRRVICCNIAIALFDRASSGDGVKTRNGLITTVNRKRMVLAGNKAL